MKLYYVANIRLPNEKAHGIQLAKQCESFCENGYDLELVVPRHKNTTEKSVREYYALSRDIPMHHIFVPRLGATRAGFNLRALWFAIASFFYLRRRVRRTPECIVYTIDLDQFSYFLLPLLRVPVFFEAHGSKLKSIFLSFFMRRVKGVIANSKGVAEKMLRDFSLPRNRVIVAPNGIDPRVFPSLLTKEEACAKLGVPSDKMIALHTGQFYDWKGLSIIAEAALLPPAMLFYLVGGTAEAFCRATGLKTIPPNVVCVGHKPFLDMSVWVAAADVLLVLGTKKNAYSYTETSPMKLFEYLASGRPIVVSKTPANCEIVSDKEAFLYEPDDARAFVKQIKNAFVAGDACSQVIAGKKKAQRYTWEERTKSITTFMQKLS